MAKSVLPNDVKFDFKDLDTSFVSDEELGLALDHISLEKQIQIDTAPSFSYQEIAPTDEMNLLQHFLVQILKKRLLMSLSLIENPAE